MTPTEQDLERAQEFAKTFNDCDFDETYGGGVAILDSGLHRIASLISQVRNETLNEVHLKLAELETLLGSNKDRNKLETGQLLGVQDAI